MSLQLQVDRLVGARAGPVDLKLQLGCGQNFLEGWLNTDSSPPPFADYLDFTRHLPFRDNTLAAVFCEHTIEHIARADAVRMVAEIHRVLRPGGVFRVVTPSLETFCRMVLEPNSPAAQTYLAWFKTYSRSPDATIIDAMNLCFYGHGHQHIYTGDALGTMLRQAGFADIALMPAGTYRHALFEGVDGHGKVVGEAINRIEAIAAECECVKRPVLET